jgi:hypothetical protein
MTGPVFIDRPRIPPARVFMALLRRDAHVAGKELPFFLLRVTAALVRMGYRFPGIRPAPHLRPPARHDQPAFASPPVGGPADGGNFRLDPRSRTGCWPPCDPFGGAEKVVAGLCRGHRGAVRPPDRAAHHGPISGPTCMPG